MKENETRERKDFETIRKNPQELQRLINVFNQMGTNVKDSPYQDIAGYHGAPKRYCHKLETAFLAWHRMYVLEFENRMRKIDPTITLPYIDWGNDKYNIPDEFTNEPILKSAMIIVNSGGFNTNRPTRRSDTRDPLELQRALDDIFQGRLKIETMIDFSNLLNGPHGSFHVWVGGDMGDPTYAAFDPIFWMHHSNVDRLWTVWQKSEFGSKIQQNDVNNKEKYLDLDFSSRGFNGIKYKDLLDNSKLPGGAHVTYQNEVTPFITRTNVRTLARSMLIETVKPKIHVSVITIKNLGHTIGSYTISVNAKIKGNKVYVGSISLFGFGKCCTKTTCKKIYDDAGETIDRVVPSFEIEAALIESIELQFDLVPTNTNKKKERVTIDAFEEELLCDDKKPVSVSLHQVGEKKEIEFHHEKNSNMFNKK